MSDDVIITESDTPAPHLPITAPSSSGDTTSEEPQSEADDKEQAEREEEVPEEVAGEGGDAGEGEEAKSEDEVEIEFGGNKRRFRKDAPASEIIEEVQGFAKQIYSDYITKTQKTAAQAKVLESRAEELQILGGASQEYFANYGVALTQGKYLDRLRQEDLSKLWQEEPDKARMVSDEIRRVEGEIQQLSTEMQRVEREAQSKLVELHAKRAEEGKKAINAVIPDFEAKYAADVIKYVTSTYDISEKDAQDWALSPAVTKMAYKAMLYDRSKAQAKAPPKVKSPEVPVTSLKGKGTARTPDPSSPDSDNLSDAEWFNLRNKQVMGKRS